KIVSRSRVRAARLPVAVQLETAESWRIVDFVIFRRTPEFSMLAGAGARGGRAGAHRVVVIRARYVIVRGLSAVEPRLIEAGFAERKVRRAAFGRERGTPQRGSRTRPTGSTQWWKRCLPGPRIRTRRQ